MQITNGRALAGEVLSLWFPRFSGDLRNRFDLEILEEGFEETFANAGYLVLVGLFLLAVGRATKCSQAACRV